MTDQAIFRLDLLDADKPRPEAWDRKAFLWSLPQPVLVLGSMALVATMVIEQWMD